MNFPEAKAILGQAAAAIATLEDERARIGNAESRLRTIEQQITDTSLRLKPIEDDHRKKTIEAAEAVRDRDVARAELKELREHIEAAHRELARINSIREQAAKRLTDPL